MVSESARLSPWNRILRFRPFGLRPCSANVIQFRLHLGDPFELHFRRPCAVFSHAQEGDKLATGDTIIRAAWGLSHGWSFSWRVGSWTISLVDGAAASSQWLTALTCCR